VAVDGGHATATDFGTAVERRRRQRFAVGEESNENDGNDVRRYLRLNNGNNNNVRPNVCVEGTSLHPGGILSRGEFLCDGTMRFGIDAANGQFILGFADPIAHGINTSATTATTTTTHSNSTDINNSSGNNNINTDTVTPTIIAWTAIPTTLFIEKTRPFHTLTLSSEGNLFGFDADGEEVYDSNYDYYNRLHSKADDSILSLSSKCGNMTAITDGSICVHLMSPQMPGMPLGEVTWGVEVHAANMVSVEPPPPTTTGLIFDHLVPEQIPAQDEYFPILGSSSQSSVEEGYELDVVPRPTSRPTKNRTRRPTSTAVKQSPTMPPSEQNSFAEEQDMPILGIEPTSIIWGRVWVDSNRNGQMGPFEKNVENLEVRLFDCFNDTSAELEWVESQRTDNQGMYFFQVPTGTLYKVHFDLSIPNFGLSSGEDADTDTYGWTRCERSRNDQPIQWNAGIYNDTAARNVENQVMPDIESLPPDVTSAGQLPVAGISPMAIAEGPNIFTDKTDQQKPTMSPVATPTMSSIGGFIYLDVDESGTMEAKEHAAAVGGYTVNDAFILVSLTDCESETILSQIYAEFPGTYSFGNLMEGYYKLGYEMVIRARSENPAYSFVGDGPASTSHETKCGKVGKNEVINDGNVGLRMAPLVIQTRVPAGGPAGLDQANLDEMEAMSSPVDDGSKSRIAAEESEGASEEGTGDKSSFVPTLVGFIITLSVLGALSILFVKHRGGDLSNAFPFLGSTNKTEDRADVRSVGSDIKGDTTVAPSADQTVIGSLVVETGKSVAGFTAMGGESGSDDNNSSSSSDEESFTGMEFALKKSASGDGVSGGDTGVGGGISATTSESLSHAEEIQEEGHEVYEVYDDEDDEEKNGHGDYGSVISDILAKFSQKSQGSSGDDEHVPIPPTQEGQGDSNDDEEAQSDPQHQFAQDQDQYNARSSAYNLNQGPQESIHHHQYHSSKAYDNQDRSQNYSHHHTHGGKQVGNPDYYQYLQNQPHYQDDPAAVPNSDSNHQDGTNAQEHYQQYESNYHRQQGYYSNDNAAAQQHQYQYGEHGQPQQQYDEQTSASASSRSSSDPPAASYRDIQHPPPNNGAMVGWGDTTNPGQQSTVDHHQYVVNDQYGAVNNQYIENAAAYDDDAYAAENYDSSDNYLANSDQYVVNEDGSYAAANYDPNHYPANINDESAYATVNYDDAHIENYGDSHPRNYDDSDPQNYDEEPQFDSENFVEDSDSDSSASTSSEEASASGWSSCSSTANSSVATESSKLSSYSSSSVAKRSIAAQARRAQSNPRDDRRRWKHHQAAIPENSTMEYNAYTMSNNEALESGGHSDSRARLPSHKRMAVSSDDNKSVLSSGSDQSGDPPGASYKNIHVFPPPPPRRTPPRKNISPKPKAGAAQRARSVPPPPPRRSYRSPSPR